MWWWFHRCILISKLIKKHVLNMFSYLNVNHTSVRWFLKYIYIFCHISRCHYFTRAWKFPFNISYRASVLETISVCRWSLWIHLTWSLYYVSWTYRLMFSFKFRKLFPLLLQIFIFSHSLCLLLLKLLLCIYFFVWWCLSWGLWS